MTANKTVLKDIISQKLKGRRTNMIYQSTKAKTMLAQTILASLFETSFMADLYCLN